MIMFQLFILTIKWNRVLTDFWLLISVKVGKQNVSALKSFLRRILLIFEQISIYYLIFLYSYVALLWVAFRRTVFSLNLKQDFVFSEFKIRVMRNSTVLCGELKCFSKTCYAKPCCARPCYAGTPCNRFFENLSLTSLVSYQTKIIQWS